MRWFLLKANKILLQRKYARIVEVFAEDAKISLEDAIDKFYSSTTYDLISNGISDMHCRGDQYLADELMIEYGYKEDNGQC